MVTNMVMGMDMVMVRSGVRGIMLRTKARFARGGWYIGLLVYYVR